MPNRRTFVAFAGGTLLALPPVLRAQSRNTARRIGFLSVFARDNVEIFVNLLRTELESLGWSVGRNIVILEPRTTAGRSDLLPRAADELIAQDLDLILVQSVPATRALMHATKTIPIVMVSVGNPIEYGIVADYGKPEGNVTGSEYPANELMRKLLQLLKEAAPHLRSVTVFNNPSNEATAGMVRQMRADALALGMQSQIIEVLNKGDLEPAFAAMLGAKAESILLPPEGLILANREAIAGFAQTHRLPLALVGSSNSLPASGLMSFGPTRAEYAQMAARHVSRILNGAKPRDLPVERPKRFELAISLKTAKTLGLIIPQSLLLRADEVIQ